MIKSVHKFTSLPSHTINTCFSTEFVSHYFLSFTLPMSGFKTTPTEKYLQQHPHAKKHCKIKVTYLSTIFSLKTERLHAFLSKYLSSEALLFPCLSYTVALIFAIIIISLTKDYDVTTFSCYEGPLWVLDIITAFLGVAMQLSKKKR